MSPEQAQMLKSALAKAYQRGYDDGYNKAQMEFFPLITVLCNRQADGTIAVMDADLIQCREVEIETGRLPLSGPGGYYYRAKK